MFEPRPSTRGMHASAERGRVFCVRVPHSLVAMWCSKCFSSRPRDSGTKHSWPMSHRLLTQGCVRAHHRDWPLPPDIRRRAVACLVRPHHIKNVIHSPSFFLVKRGSEDLKLPDVRSTWQQRHSIIPPSSFDLFVRPNAGPRETSEAHL